MVLLPPDQKRRDGVTKLKIKNKKLMAEDSRDKASSIALEHPYVRGEKLTFESFLPFIKVGDEKLRERFTDLLRTLFNEAGGVWRPGRCYEGIQIIELAVKNAKANKILGNESITVMNWADGHYYLTLKITGSDQDLIVDPFGIPTLGKNYLDKHQSSPFFGELKLAPSRHQRIYSDAKPIGGVN